MKHTRMIYPDAGLGNRLYCLYSGLYWKKKLRIEISILWEIEYACCISFNRLFRDIPNTNVKTVYTLSVRGRHGLKSAMGKIYINALRKSPFYYSSEKTGELYKDVGEAGIEKILTENKDFCIKSNSPFADMTHLAEVVDMIKPAEDIERRVNETMNKYTGKEVIGIHIRRTDNRNAIENSPLESFVLCMKKLQDVNPNIIFYVATDDEEVEKNIKQRFPVIKHNYFYEGKSRKTERGMKDAYVDMLCLSRCKIIYGSYGSSFSQLASLIGGIECIVVRNMENE